MPKDDTTPATDGPVDSDLHGAKAPLKRGDACLYCRRRRIRCNAGKPSCAHCIKLKRDCVYDNGKPVSRVKQLEEKVAELEGLLTSNASAGVVVRKDSDGGASTSGSGSGQAVGASRGGGTAGSANARGSMDTGVPGTINPNSLRTQNSGGDANQNQDRTQNQGFFGPAQPLAGQSTQYSVPLGTEPRTEINFASMQVDPSDWAAGHRYHGGGTFNTPLTSTGAGIGSGNPNWQGFGPSAGANASGSSTGGPMNGIQTTPLPPAPVQRKPEEVFDFASLDPSFVNLINQFQATNAGSTENQRGQGGLDRQMGPASVSTSTTRQQSQRQGPSFSTGTAQPFDSFSPGTNRALDTPGLIDLLTSSNDQMGTEYNFASNEGMQMDQNMTSGFPAQIFPPTTNTASMAAFSAGQGGSSAFQATVETVPEVSEFAPPNQLDPMSRFGGDPSVQDLVIGITDQDPSPSDPPPMVRAFVQGRQTFSGTGTGSGSGHTPAGTGPASGSRIGSGLAGWSDPELDGLPVVGGWFDAADLPAIARDHLLDLFFGKMHTFGQVYHVPRFRMSLGLPPSRRPHPCLLYTMYLLGSRMSDSPSIRSLESHFYSIALRQLEESVARADRLFDATRAATMLAVYKFSLARYHEGYMMTGMAARLAVGAGLHQITSSVFKPAKYALNRQAALGELMRQRAYVIGPPTDAIDLGERIWAFWAIYTVDRCGAISSQWPPALANEIISTPFPRPLAEYELGLVSEKDNISIAHLWCPPHLNYCPRFNVNDPGNGMIFRVRSLAILEKASNLMYLPPEPGWDANLNLTQTSNNPSPGASLGGVASGFATGFGSGNTWAPWTDQQPIDDFLRTQNFAAWQFDEQAKMFAAGSGGGGGMGMGMGMGMASGPSPGMSGRRSFSNNTPAPFGGFNPAAMPGSGTGTGTGNSPSGMSEGTANSKAWTRCAKVRTPKAYEEVRQALLRVEMDKEPHARIDWEVWNGWDEQAQAWHREMMLKKEAMATHFVIGCAWMFLFDVFSFAAENTLAVNVARRLTYGVHVLMQEDAFNAMDVFTAMVWSFIVKILIREVKRLHSIGSHKDAGPIESEIEIIVQALQTFGKRYNIASMQALRADRYRKSTPQETAFMNEEDYDDEVPA